VLPSRTVPHETREAYRLDRLASYLAGAYQGAIFPFAGLRYVFLVALFFILIGCWMQLAGLRRTRRPRPGVPAVAS
jgi:hypothetical protein